MCVLIYTHIYIHTYILLEGALSKGLTYGSSNFLITAALTFTDQRVNMVDLPIAEQAHPNHTLRYWGKIIG